ncbi:YadA C-terminal domain-containing protein [[Enterobacter] lignolyticus]|uniref:YadA domain-containing protein n=1 Tax=Enterobacter lignolyticus (strain SCF1) TaxID=701347 RepID=E3GBY0_ENTLS|nr:YadA C-terminal domain-containing protein [[Enterobacter] lignolyticus]ADO47774.1 YadA domain-containing protein [[Enterobacter] lignolyticus SCF1]
MNGKSVKIGFVFYFICSISLAYADNVDDLYSNAVSQRINSHEFFQQWTTLTVAQQNYLHALERKNGIRITTDMSNDQLNQHSAYNVGVPTSTYNPPSSTNKTPYAGDSQRSGYTVTVKENTTVVDPQPTVATGAGTPETNPQPTMSASENAVDLVNHEQRISSLEKGLSSLNSEVDSNRKRASVGVAGVAAMANIPQVTESQTFSIGAGLGTNDSDEAVAVGFSARLTNHIVTKAAVSAGSYGGATLGAGMAYGW